jgi:hypothetical protein
MQSLDYKSQYCKKKKKPQKTKQNKKLVKDLIASPGETNLVSYFL